MCFLVSKEQNGGFTTTNSGLSVEIYNYSYLYICVCKWLNQDLAGYKPKNMRLLQAFFGHDDESSRS